MSLCIPLELSDGIFEHYHSGLMTSHQGLTRTYYKIRQDFFIRNLYKYLHLYIMSCRVWSARRDIPFNQKQRSRSLQVIHDFAIMKSINMDLKVMPTSFRGYNYLLVMRCNHSRFIITDTLKSRKASQMAESLFQKLICTHSTNIKEIYYDSTQTSKTKSNLLCSAFYHFTDYLDLLNKHIHAIRDIVKENHNQTIEKRLQKHGSDSPALHSFNEGDVVYCHIPSKTIISDLKLASKSYKCHLLDHCTFS